jgi:hypothetical protein
MAQSSRAYTENRAGETEMRRRERNNKSLSRGVNGSCRARAIPSKDNMIDKVKDSKARSSKQL